ncbi:MAG: TfoX/Sxy family protein [Fimbriimonadaceae bacterium]
MSTKPETAAKVVQALEAAGSVRVKRMFGEYGVYLNDKFIGVICDDILFLKPTPAGEDILEIAEFAPPYPGARPHLIVPTGLWGDAELMAELAQATHDALPAQKPKQPRSR